MVGIPLATLARNACGRDIAVQPAYDGGDTVATTNFTIRLWRFGKIAFEPPR
jgi:hypothetical protein